MIRRAALRAIGIFGKMGGILIFYLLSMLSFAYLIRLYLFGTLCSPDISREYYDSPSYFIFNFSSYATTVTTLLFMVTTNNTPDLALLYPDYRHYFIPVYVCISMFNLLLASGVILAFINDSYKEIFQEELEELGTLSKYRKTILQAIKMLDDPEPKNYNQIEEFVISKYSPSE